MNNLEIIKASAGSGKTFTLSRRFLALTINDPESFRHILAVTFTNKATEEMKSRILKELHILASGSASPHIDYLLGETGLDESGIRKKARAVLSNILHHYSDFSVSTIDSFFQRVFQSYLYELNIRFNYDITLDSKTALDESVSRLMASLNPGTQTANWLLSLVREKMQDDKSYRIDSNLKKIGYEIFSENFWIHQNELFEKIQDNDFLNDYLAELDKIINHFETGCNKIADEALSVIKTNNIDWEQFSYGAKSSVPSFFLKVKQKDFEIKKRTEDGESNSLPWIKNKKDTQLLSLVENQLQPLLIKLLIFIRENIPGYNSAISIRKHFHALGLSVELAIHLRDYLNEKSLVLINDISRFLAGLIENDGAPFVYEKIGTRFNHFMLDEFQDTSKVQWKNFRPLLENSLAEGSYNLVVGDVKQSIYRWRNSDWSLLATELGKTMKSYSGEPFVLKENWRSSPVIVNFNNQLYKSASLLIQQSFDDQQNNSGLSVSGLYNDQEQQSPDELKNKPGYVEINTFPKNEFSAMRNAALQDEILELWNNGHRDIAILVRNNKEIGELFELLYQLKDTERKPVRVVTGEALSLNLSPAVNIITGMFRYLVNPGDNSNQLHLVNEYYRYWLAGNEDKYFHNPDAFEHLIEGKGLNNTRELLSIPLYELAEKIAHSFDLYSRTDQLPYLLAFFDAIIEINKNSNHTLIDFLYWWDENKTNRKITLGDEKEAVKIMTIHKSKGLEFEVVILSNVNWNLDHSGNNLPILWCTPQVEPFNRLPIVPVQYQKNLENSIFSKDYQQERLYVHIDNLNLLYVATTRAINALYIYINEPTKNKPESTGDLIHTSILGNNELQDKIVKQENRMSTGNKLPVQKLTSKPEYPDSAEILPGTGNNRFHILVEDEHSSLFQAEAIDDALAYGNIIHRILEKAKTKDDISDAINKMVQYGIIDQASVNNINKQIDKLFTLEEVVEWFTPGKTVYNEQPLLTKSGDIRRPDRIIANGKHAIIIDYKTGTTTSEEYEKQLRYYARLLKETGFESTEGWLLYINLVKAVKVF